MAYTRSLRSRGTKQTWGHDSFAGGYVTDTPRHLLSDSQFHDGQNVSLSKSGSAAKRGGWQKSNSIASLGSGGIIGSHEFRDNAGNAEFFIVHNASGGAKLYRENDAVDGYKHVRVALRGPISVSAELNGTVGVGAEFTPGEDMLYVVVPESTGAAYATGEGCEVAYIQQANPVQRIKVSYTKIRSTESYRLYRYTPSRGWEKISGLNGGAFGIDAGSGAVAGYPPILPTDKFPTLHGVTPTEVNFTTVLNQAVFADGRSLYRYGQYGIDLLPTPIQDFETTIPLSLFFSGTAAVAYSTNWAYTGTKSMLMTYSADSQYVELDWPLRGGLAQYEAVRVTGRVAMTTLLSGAGIRLQISVLDSGGSVLQSSTQDITPNMTAQQFNLSHLVTSATADRLRIRFIENGTGTPSVYLDDFHVYADAAEILRPYDPTDAEVDAIGSNLLLTATSSVWECEVLAPHANRLWLGRDPADATVTWYSQIANLTYIPANYFAKAETRQDDRITTMYNHRERLMLWTRDNFQRIDGTGPGAGADAYTWNLVHPSIGCIAPRTVVPIDNGLAWVWRDGVYLAETVEAIQDYWNVRRISEPIQIGYDAVVSTANLELATTAFVDGELWVHFPDKAKGFRWYRPGTIRQEGVWAPADVLTAPFGNAFHDLLVRRDGSLYATHYTVGLVYKLDATALNDDGAVIDFQVKKQYNLGDPGKQKLVYLVRVRGRRFAAAWDLSVTAATDTDAATTKTLSFSASGSDPVPAEWKEAAFELRGRILELTFKNNTLAQAAEIEAVEVEHRLLRG